MPSILKSFIVSLFCFMLATAAWGQGSCALLFGKPDVEDAASDLKKRILKQTDFVTEAIKRVSFNDQSGDNSWKRKMRFWTKKPVGSKTVKTDLDAIDQELHARTSREFIELGRFEVKNDRNETLGYTLFTSGNRTHISGEVIGAALVNTFAQAYATGRFFEISKLVFTHTHPPLGDSELFSDRDIELFNSLKASLEALGLDRSALEASILYEGFFGEPIRKTLLVPASATVNSGAYVTERADLLNSATAKLAYFTRVAERADEILKPDTANKFGNVQVNSANKR